MAKPARGDHAVAAALASLALLACCSASLGGEPLRRWAFALDAQQPEFRLALGALPVADAGALSLVIDVQRIQRSGERFYTLRAEALCASGETAWSTTLALYPLDRPSRFARPLLRPGQTLDACAPTLVLQLQMPASAAGDVNAELPSLSGEVIIERSTR